jgi:formylglycine-generating enzyme required for sulfatase activity
MVSLEGATFLVGAEGPECVATDREGPVREIEVGAFAIDPCAVSNSRFATFVEAAGYVTDAERYGWSFVFGGLLPDEFPDTRGAVEAPCLLAPARGAALLDRRPARSSRRPCLLARRRGVLSLERGEAAERGRVGVRGSRRPGREALSLGR